MLVTVPQIRTEKFYLNYHEREKKVWKMTYSKYHIQKKTGEEYMKKKKRGSVKVRYTLVLVTYRSQIIWS